MNCFFSKWVGSISHKLDIIYLQLEMQEFHLVLLYCVLCMLLLVSKQNYNWKWNSRFKLIMNIFFLQKFTKSFNFSAWQKNEWEKCKSTKQTYKMLTRIKFSTGKRQHKTWIMNFHCFFVCSFDFCGEFTTIFMEIRLATATKIINHSNEYFFINYLCHFSLPRWL